MPGSRVVIAGGGLAGSLAALALAQRRPDVDLLLLEQSRSFGGNHIWSFFDADVRGEDRWLIEPLVAKRWPDHEVRFPERQRRLGFGYNSVRSSLLDEMVRRTLRPSQYRLGAQIADLGPDYVSIADGTRIPADAVIDARGAGAMPGLQLAWQKFVGRTYRFDRGHGVPRPVIMDAMVEQRDGYRFVYSLPFSATELLVEDTYYSNSAELDRERLGAGLHRMVPRGERIGEETGILPVLLDGELQSLWPASEAPVGKLGLRGGFFHPTTGYSLPDAVTNALLIAQQADLDGPAIHATLRQRAATLWEERKFFQLLNRMLFQAARPQERYRVLQHFYRLPEPLIQRFYAARLTAFDKVRILTGRPPVPIGRALASIRGAAA